MRFSSTCILHFALLALPGFALAQSTLPSQEVLEQQAREQEALEQDAAIDHAAHAEEQQQHEGEQNADSSAAPEPLSNHATVQAPPELGGLASREPELFVGKTIVLAEGSQQKTVGTVFAVRKRTQDQLNYFIVDATEYFNSPTEYAIAVKNVDRVEDDQLITPAAPGMHLMGMQYYPDDYEDIPAPVVVPIDE